MISTYVKKYTAVVLVICSILFFGMGSTSSSNSFFCPVADATSVAVTQNWIKYANTSWYNKSKKVFTISKPEQLAGLAKLVNSQTASMKGKTIKLGNSIDLSGKYWTPIGKSLWITGGIYEGFAGNFDGCGNTITGMQIGSSQKPESTLRNVGLFGAIRDGSVKNLGVQGTIYSSKKYAVIGGLVSEAESSDFTNCTFKGDLHSSKASIMGGLFGNSGGHSKNGIKNCSAEGSIEGGDHSDLGGLSGWSNSIIDSSWSTVSVTGHDSANIGGFVGSYQGPRINWCFSTGPVSGGYCAGGFIGEIQYYEAQQYIKIKPYITNSFSSGAVSASGPFGSTSGGFIGITLGMNVINCYSLGNVMGIGPDSEAGGFVGQAGTCNKVGEYCISNCFSSGAIELTNGKPEKICGVAVNTYFDSLINVFWNSDLTSAKTAVSNNYENASRLKNLTGKTSEEMKSKAFVDLMNKNKDSIKGLPKDINLVNWEQSSTVNDGFPVLEGIGPVKN